MGLGSNRSAGLVEADGRTTSDYSLVKMTWEEVILTVSEEIKNDLELVPL